MFRGNEKHTPTCIEYLNIAQYIAATKLYDSNQ